MLTDDHAAPLMPLNHHDCKALTDIFADFNVEQLTQIEAMTSRFIAPLEPWEEVGWVVCSSVTALVPAVKNASRPLYRSTAVA